MTPSELTEQAQRDGAALERARILGVVATPADAEELATALRAYHDGSERGELRRLLVRLWGPSPAVVATCEKCRKRPARTDGVYCAECHGAGGHPVDLFGPDSRPRHRYAPSPQGVGCAICEWVESAHPQDSDIRGLAARESQPERNIRDAQASDELDALENKWAHTGVAASWCPICGDCRCPYVHGIEDNGRTRDDPNCPLHGTKTTHPCSDFGCDCHGPVSP